jgi:hypothetical protein
MENFTKNLEDEILREELFHALNNKSPFANFKRVINKSNQADNWFLFKMDSLEDYVKQIIHNEIYTNNEDPDGDELPF